MKEGYDHLILLVALVKYLNNDEIDDGMRFELANKYMWN